MKKQLILPAFAIVLVAVVLALSLQGGGSRGAIEPAVGGLALEPQGLVDELMAASVQALKDENARLMERIVALENRPVIGGDSRIAIVDGFVSEEDFGAFREEVQRALETLGVGTSKAVGAGGPTAEDVAMVTAVIDENQRRKNAAAARALEEKRLRGLDNTLAKMDDWLELTPQQSGDMRSALQTQMDRQAELTRRWKAGEDTGALGELKAGDREAHRTDLSAILSPEQLERYFARREGNGK